MGKTLNIISIICMIVGTIVAISIPIIRYLIDTCKI